MSNNSEQGLVHLVDSVRSLYGAIGRFDECMATSMGIDRTSLRAIDALRYGALQPKDFAERLGLTTASVTAMLDRLEKAGHISRTQSPTDRRSWIINLTDQSREQAKKSYGNLGDTFQTVFADKTNAELAKALEVIEELTQAFDASGDQ